MPNTFPHHANNNGHNSAFGSQSPLCIRVSLDVHTCEANKLCGRLARGTYCINQLGFDCFRYLKRRDTKTGARDNQTEEDVACIANKVRETCICFYGFCDKVPCAIYGTVTLALQRSLCETLKGSQLKFIPFIFFLCYCTHYRHLIDDKSLAASDSMSIFASWLRFSADSEHAKFTALPWMK